MCVCVRLVSEITAGSSDAPPHPGAAPLFKKHDLFEVCVEEGERGRDGADNHQGRMEDGREEKIKNGLMVMWLGKSGLWRQGWTGR